MFFKKYLLVKLLLICFVAVGMSLILYRFFLCPYLPSNVDINANHFFNLFDFYSELPPDAILFIGDSQTVEGIDIHIISNRTENLPEMFNLGLYGDDYLNRNLVIDKIIDSRPSVVILGISPHTISSVTNNTNLVYYESLTYELSKNENTFFQRLRLAKNWLHDPLGNLFFVFSEKVPSRCFWRKHSFFPDYYEYQNQDIKNLPSYATNFKDPHLELNENYSQKIELDNGTILSWSTNPESNPRKEALQKFIEKLLVANTKVIVIDMPVNPWLLKNIPSISKLAYSRYINESIGPLVTYYSFHSTFPSSFFFDGTHLNNEGRQNLSISIANILKEMQ